MEILSGLRKLQDQTVKIIDNMTIEYDITKDVRYKQGEEKGKTKNVITIIVNMHDKGFEEAFISELLEVPFDFVTMILAQLKHRDSVYSLLKAGKNMVEIAEMLNVSPLLIEVLKEGTRLPLGAMSRT